LEYERRIREGTIPDISRAHSELSKFVQCPGQNHMDAAEYCLKYLAGTVNLCIHYGRTKDGKIEGRELNRLWAGWTQILPLILIRAGLRYSDEWRAYQLEVCEAEECVSQHSRKRVVCRK
jgi:hypothetical protein